MPENAQINQPTQNLINSQLLSQLSQLNTNLSKVQMTTAIPKPMMFFNQALPYTSFASNQYIPLTPTTFGGPLYTPSSPVFWQTRTTPYNISVLQMIGQTPPAAYLTPIETKERMRQVALYSELPKMMGGWLGGAVGGAFLGPVGSLIGGILGYALTPTPEKLLSDEIAPMFQTLFSSEERIGYKSLGLEDAVKLRRAMKEVSYETFSFTEKEVRELSKQLVSTSLMRGVRTAEEFKENMSKLVKNVREISDALKVSYEDAVKFMETFSRMGIKNAPELASRTAFNIRTYSAALRMNEGALTERIVSTAQQLYNIGYTGESALKIAQTVPRFLSAIKTINPTQYRQLTGNYEEEILSALETLIGGSLENQQFNYMMLAAVNPQIQNGRLTATPDYEMLRRITSGEIPAEQIMSIATQKIQQSGATWLFTSPSARRRLLESTFIEHPETLMGMIYSNLRSSPEFRQYKLTSPQLSEQEVMRDILIDKYRLPENIATRLVDIFQYNAQNPEVVQRGAFKLDYLSEYEQSLNRRLYSMWDNLKSFFTSIPRFFTGIGTNIQREYASFIDRLTFRKNYQYSLEPLKNQAIDIFEQLTQPSTLKYESLIQALSSGREITPTLETNVSALSRLALGNEAYKLIAPEVITGAKEQLTVLKEKSLTPDELRAILNELLGKSILGIKPSELNQMLNKINDEIKKAGQININGKTITAEQWNQMSQTERERYATQYLGQQAVQQVQEANITANQALQQLYNLPEYRQLSSYGQKIILSEALRDKTFAQNPAKWLARKKAELGLGPTINITQEQAPDWFNVFSTSIEKANKLLEQGNAEQAERISNVIAKAKELFSVGQFDDALKLIKDNMDLLGISQAEYNRLVNETERLRYTPITKETSAVDVGTSILNQLTYNERMYVSRAFLTEDEEARARAQEIITNRFGERAGQVMGQLALTPKAVFKEYYNPTEEIETNYEQLTRYLVGRNAIYQPFIGSVIGKVTSGKFTNTDIDKLNKYLGKVSSNALGDIKDVLKLSNLSEAEDIIKHLPTNISGEVVQYKGREIGIGNLRRYGTELYTQLSKSKEFDKLKRDFIGNGNIFASEEEFRQFLTYGYLLMQNPEIANKFANFNQLLIALQRGNLADAQRLIPAALNEMKQMGIVYRGAQTYKTAQETRQSVYNAIQGSTIPLNVSHTRTRKSFKQITKQLFGTSSFTDYGIYQWNAIYNEEIPLTDQNILRTAKAYDDEQRLREFMTMAITYGPEKSEITEQILNIISKNPKLSQSLRSDLAKVLQKEGVANRFDLSTKEGIMAGINYLSEKYGPAIQTSIETGTLAIPSLSSQTQNTTVEVALKSEQFFRDLNNSFETFLQKLSGINQQKAQQLKSAIAGTNSNIVIITVF